MDIFRWQKSADRVNRGSARRAWGRARGRRRVVPFLELERLEDRVVLSVTASLQPGGVLLVQGDANPDDVTLRLEPGNAGLYQVLDHGVDVTNSPFATASITSVTVDGGSGDMALTID